jgi:probable F420-dependent oxidoreductase
MDVGVALFPTDETVHPAWLATHAEEAGFESIFFPEHTHIPASRGTPYPIGGDLPREYSRIMDQFVAASAAAAVTKTLRVGTGICLVNQHHPITCAKAGASVDYLSGGRFLFGVGAGWNREEMENHGVDPATKFGLMCERIEAIRAIWTHEEASFRGSDVEFDRIWSWPKPIQRPHPPFLVSGNGTKVLDRVLAHGDHWMPNIVGGDDVVLGRIAELRTRAAAAGREVGVTVNAAPTRPERLERYVEAGVDRCVFYLPPGGNADDVERKLERIVASVETVGILLR